MADSPPRVYHMGSEGDDVLIGDGSNDAFYGNGGNDIMRGGGYIDLLFGGLGDDIYDGGDDEDYAGFGWAVRVDLAIQGPQDTGEGRDTFISIENLFGSAYNDVLKGNDRRNQIQGDAGNDVLEGRGGDDALWGGSGADEIHGGAGADLITGDEGNDLLFGDAGDDTFLSSFGDDLYDGGDGVDAVAFFTDVGVTVDLTLAGRQEIAPSVYATFVSIERIQSTRYADRVLGSAADNFFSGDQGNDYIDGRGGYDVYVSSASLKDLVIEWTIDGWRITDTRSGSYNEGVDVLKNVELLRSEGYGPTRILGDGMAYVVSNILRLGDVEGGSYSSSLSARLASGALTLKTAVDEIVSKAGGTTSVASLSYEFFTGKVPGAAGIDYLVSPTGPNARNLNSYYYESFNLENRYINFAVNLGKFGEGKDSFTAKYGSLTLFDATREAYKTIFGGTPTDAKVHALIDTRADYFASYGGDGVGGIGTKAAMVGWLLAEAQKADVGVMAKSNDAWLADLADGDAPFAIDILDPAKGYYKADFIYGG